MIPMQRKPAKEPPKHHYMIMGPKKPIAPMVPVSTPVTPTPPQKAPAMTSDPMVFQNCVASTLATSGSKELAMKSFLATNANLYAHYMEHVAQSKTPIGELPAHQAFKTLVDAETAKGTPRDKAASKVVKENPTVHQAMKDEAAAANKRPRIEFGRRPART